MVYSSVVVLQPDEGLGQALTSMLLAHFDSIHMARELGEFRDKIIRNRPRVLVMEMEGARAEDVRGLRRDFPGLPIVCTHRIPDDGMWADALEAGASDVCPTYDLGAVVGSAVRSAKMESGAAA